jgi:hypothetical protein
MSLLGELLSYFEWDKAVLCRLALQFRMLSTPVPRRLFRYSEASTPDQLQLLERSFEENLDLALHVRVCSVTCLEHDIDNSHENQVSQKLSRFPNPWKFIAYRNSRFLSLTTRLASYQR